MSQPPEVSVLLPVFNGAAYLRESIDSVLGQEGCTFELVACDDASTDGSALLLDARAGDPRVQVRRHRVNAGLFPTLNELIGASRAPILHLWAQDDRMRPGCLARTLAFWRRHPSLGLAYCQYDAIDADGRLVTPAPRDRTPEVIPPWLAAQLAYYHGCLPGNIANVSLRRAALDEVGPFDPSFRVAGDWDLWTRLGERFDTGFLAEPLIELRRHDRQLSRARTSALRFVSENRRIRARLEALLPEELREEARRYDRRHRRVIELHQVIRAAQRLDLSLARALLRELRSEGPLARVALRWLLSANGRWGRPTARIVAPPHPR